MFAVKASGCGYDERATTAEWDGQATNASAQISAERNSGYRGGYSGLSYRSAGNAPELRAASRARNRPARKIRGRDRCCARYGRAIAVEMALNGADIAAIDICGPVSPASDAKPATPADLDETVRQVRGYGRRCIRIEADIRDIGKLRHAAAHIQQEYGRIDIVVADAAIQRWKPLLEMEDSDWRDVIDNNLNGTANRYAPLHRYWSVSAMGESSSCPRCKASTGPKMPAHIRHRSGAFLG